MRYSFVPIQVFRLKDFRLEAEVPNTSA